MHILLTGATGFIGSAIADYVARKDHKISVIVRKKSYIFDDKVEQIICDLEDFEGLRSEIFTKVDCVIHSAARAHVMRDKSFDPLNEYRKSNRDMTLNIAKLASKNGVKRFIFLSSIKVNGEKTYAGTSFKPDDLFFTNDPYGISKYEAENELLKLASKSTIEVVIIRLPLVYGPNVKGNFASMVRWVKKGIPLPFGKITNKRSLIAIDNLVDFVYLCTDSKKSTRATNEIFIISDNKDISTTILLQRVARAYGVKPILLPVPVFIMRFVALILGKSRLSDRLFGNLQVDSSKASELLDWKPVTTMDEQLTKMANFDQRNKKI